MKIVQDDSFGVHSVPPFASGSKRIPGGGGSNAMAAVVLHLGARLLALLGM